MVGAFALFSWGCGNTTNGDITSSGGFPVVSPTVVISPTPTPTPVTNTTIVYATQDAKINVTNGAAASTVNITYQTSAGANVITVGPLAYNHSSITVVLSLPASTIATIAKAVFLFYDANGRLISGTTQNQTITAGTTNNDPITATTTVANLTAVTVSTATPNITTANGTATFSLVGTFSIAGTGNVTSNITGGANWTSSNTAIATVSNTGVATANGTNGSVNITAVVANPAGNTTSGSASLTVAVTSNVTTVTNLTILPAALTLGIGNSSQLGANATVNGTVTNVTANTTFTSSNASIANTTAGGNVTGVAAGNATISGSVNISGIAANSTANSNVTVSANATNGTLTLSANNPTTVVGGNVTITGTVNGTAVNVALAVGNTGIAAVSNNTLTGVSVGTTNFTATSTPFNLTAQGNITIVNGNLQATLVMNPGTAFSMNEGDQVQFRAQAQFATSGGNVVLTDVTNQCVWLVTQGAATANGDIFSFDAGAGDFTATRGSNAGTNQIQVGALFSNSAAFASANTTVTIARVNPVNIIVTPVGSTEQNNSRVPLGGWDRLYQAVAVYTSGYQKVLGSDVQADVTWTGTGGNVTSFGGGRADFATATATGTATVGSGSIKAQYNNSLSGTQSTTHTIGTISYQLQSATANFAVVQPTDYRAIPGSTSSTAAAGFCRPITVTATFSDRNSPGNNLVMALFQNPAGGANVSKGGAMSIYLNPNAYPTGTNPRNSVGANTTAQVIGARNTANWITTGITPVGYTHVLRNVTTASYASNVLNLRLMFRSAGGGNNGSFQGFDRISGSGTAEVAGTAAATGASIAFGTDSDLARTATLSNITLDGATALSINVTNQNLRRGQGTNATFRASYQAINPGTFEDVTALSDLSLSTNGAGNISIGNVTTGTGTVKGRVLGVLSVATAGNQQNVNYAGHYPATSFANATCNATNSLNITLP